MNTATPVNEFTDNDEFFLHGFAHLFLLGEGLVTHGAVVDRDVRHWLLQHDGRFARSMPLVFALFNQLQRHAVCLHASLRVKGGNSSKFVALANDADFRERLERAIANPKSADARAIVMTIMR